MGVYHLMGLGRSPGTVTGPLSYLAHRYQRWGPEDQHFFSRSGKVVQREQAQKVGDVQSLVLFTTREVLTGEILTFEYVNNSPGRVTKGPEENGGAMKDILRQLLHQEWPGISGGRSQGSIFWCEVNRRDVHSTYERVAQVVAALAGVGGQGHEMWINLTGGNNVINLALELAANLSGDVARLYYVQAENRPAERCVRFTAENGYWVELPVMPLALGRLNHAILEILQRESPTNSKDLYSHLLGHEKHWNLAQGVSFESFREIYLMPIWKQGLVAEAEAGYVIGPQWELIKPYEGILDQARQAQLTIEQLAQREPWIEREKLGLS